VSRAFHVVIHVVIRDRYGSKEAQSIGTVLSIDLTTLENGLGGRESADFGTVRPRVQIPGPRPNFEYDSGLTAYPSRTPYHSRITISRDGALWTLLLV
jgi:hypothetical protein